MKKSELITAVAAQSGMTKKDTARMLEATINCIEQALLAGDKVLLPQLGTFEVRTRAARMCSNPRTGQLQQVPESRALTFRAANNWKEKVNKPL